MLPKSDPLPSIPTLRDVSPKYAEMEDRFIALNDRIPAIIAALREVYPRINAGPSGSSNADERAVTERAARIAALTGDVAKGGKENGSPAESPGATYARLNRELEDTREAIDLLGRKIREETASASRLVCERTEQAYHSIVARLFETLIEVHAATRNYHEFADRMNAEGVMWTRMRPMPPFFLGSPKDREGSLSRYMRECVEYNFAPAAMLPWEFK